MGWPEAARGTKPIPVFVRRLVASATALALASTLLPTCADSEDCIEPTEEDPCPTAFDVVEFCNNSQCTENTAPISCTPDLCPLTRGRAFSVPIAEFAGQLGGRDLIVQMSAGCSRQGSDPVLQVSIDGVPATASRLETQDVFSWDPFPAEPQSLEIFYDGEESIECVDLAMSFADAACKRRNPNCPL